MLKWVISVCFLAEIFPCWDKNLYG